jgi:hypothetical protein
MEQEQLGDAWKSFVSLCRKISLLGQRVPDSPEPITRAVPDSDPFLVDIGAIFLKYTSRWGGRK